jgi:anti-sigma regulatory factor (Ser/Thr protein kinase)
MSGFHHEALFYAGDDEYVAGLLPDMRTALDAQGAVMVAVAEDKAQLLRDALGVAAGRVAFADMAQLGRNPGRILPAWREFVADGGSGPRLGIGEPVWPGRTRDELVECRRHESMLNLAFDGGEPWRLLCPYDIEALSPEVLADARHSHPQVSVAGITRRSDEYLEPPTVLSWDGALPDPESPPAELEFTWDDLPLVRQFVVELADEAGIVEPRLADLVLAIHELATNSVRHGGGSGQLRVWRENGTFVCEVADAGHITDPLAGRERVPHGHGGGRGLWLVNQLCDLVQLRSSRTGNVVRVNMSVAAAE